MRRSIVDPICWIALVLLFAGASFAQMKASGTAFAMRSGNCDFLVDKNGSIMTIAEGQRSALLPSVVAVYDGKSGDKEIQLKLSSGAVVKGGNLICEYTNENGTLRVSQSMCSNRDRVFCNLTIRNSGKEQAWLKVAVKVPLYFQESTVNYWDGLSLKDEFQGQSSNANLYSTFPAAAVYSGKSGVALGIAADQMFSHIENSLVYESSKILSYSVKSVVDPGKDGIVSFVMYGFRPEFGFLNAMNSYYEEYPKFFKPTEGVDTSILYTAHAGGFHGQEGTANDYGDEAIRRSFGQIYWWYAPFRKAGDFWGTEDEYKVKLKHEDLVAERFKGTASQQQVRLKKEFTNAKYHGVSPMHYIINWCEEDLADRKYPNNVIRYSDGSNTKIDPWVQTWTGDVCMWWGDKFGSDSRDALKKIVDYYDIEGFAVDCAEGNGNRPARIANGIQEAPGRAYDDGGLYCDEGIAIAQMIDFIHTLKKDGKVMIAWPNFSFPSPYFTAFRVDASLCEPDFQTVLRDFDVHQRIRYLMGSKPRQLLLSTERESIGKSMNSGDMSPEQIKDMYRNLWDTGLLMCLKLAYYPNPEMLYGYPGVMKSMPVIAAVIKEGWEPVPAITLDTDLWTARYGRDLRAYIYVGNQKTAAKTINASVSNSYLGKGNYLFSTFDGAEIDNDVRAGKTHMSFSLPSKQYQMLKAMARVEGASDMRCRVKATSDGVSGSVSISAESSERRPVKIAVRIPRDATAMSVKVDGRSVRFHSGDGEVDFKTRMSSSTKIETDWKSNIFLSSAKEIKNYPFVVGDDKPNCSILIADGADEWDKAAANRISEYFGFYYSNVNAKTVRIPVQKVSDPIGSAMPQVRIGLDSSNGLKSAKGTVLVSHNNLCLNASDSRARYALVLQLLRLLDEQYPYYGRISGKARDEDTVKLRDKAGLGPGGILE